MRWLLNWVKGVPRWQRKIVGDFPLYQASTMSWMPGVVQGFTTRQGGVSVAPYDSLNLGGHVGDSPDAVLTNRTRLWGDLGFAPGDVALAEQVHGDCVERVYAGSDTPVPGVDALITDTPGVLLMLFFADCVPVFIYDPQHRAVGLAHAGWRGAAQNIVGKTITAMRENFDTDPAACLMAVGPCISADSYEVGIDVADHFRNLATGKDSGAANVVIPRNEYDGTFSLDLRQVVFLQALWSGLRAESIAVCDQDTYRNRKDFFSYRREGKTGRMAAFLGVRARGRS